MQTFTSQGIFEEYYTEQENSTLETMVGPIAEK